MALKHILTKVAVGATLALAGTVANMNRESSSCFVAERSVNRGVDGSSPGENRRKS